MPGPAAADTINLVSPDGSETRAVPVDQAGYLVAKGYQPETSEHEASRVGQEGVKQAYGGTGGQIAAGVYGLARGATLGLSDAALRALGGEDAQRALAGYQAQNPTTSTVTTIAGAVAPALLTGGDSALAGLAERTPAGFTANIGAKIAEATGGGILGTAARGAFEGAAMNAGQYVSDVALGNRDLSAEGFMGAMGKGALYGGVSAGALSVASHGLLAARRLFPIAEQTPEALQAAEMTARNSIKDSVQTSKRLEDVAANQNREAEQFLQDLEAERTQAIQQATQPESQVAAKRSPFMRDQGPYDVTSAGPASSREGSAVQAEIAGTGTAPEIAGETAPEAPTVSNKTAKQLLADWRAKYPAGVVDYDAANSAARQGRLAEWAKGFDATTPEDETIKAYFESPQDPMRTAERIGGTDVPPAIKKAAQDAANDAAHRAYLEAVPQAANVAKSGTELMARATYAGRRAAARAMDDVYTAYKAGTPIADIARAAKNKLDGQLHELAAAREDMIKSLAQKSSADDLLEQLTGTQQAIQQGQPLKSIGERILEGAKRPVDPDEVISNALGKSKDVNADIADVAPKITRYEAAKAQLTEAIGPKATPEAIAHAQAFRAAQQEAEEASTRGIAQATENVDKLQRGIPPDKVAGGKGLLKGISDLGTKYQLLRSLGMPLPSLRGIPVIGPLLSAYLKAKILSKMMGKFGGSFAATAEGTIAAKAAATQNRIHEAIQTMLTGSSRVVAKSAELTGPMVLGHKLFDDGQKQPYSSEPKGGSLQDMYQARMNELVAAQKPGAIEEAVKARINTSDPTIVDAIVATQQRGLNYLYSIAPKPDAPPIPGQKPRPPSEAEIKDWIPAVAAFHDPAAVFEKVAKGGKARPAEIKCLQNCYPQLMATAQKHAAEKLADAKSPLPYGRRLAISDLIGIPMDESVMPDHAAFLQGGFTAPAPMPTMPMPHPSLSADIKLGQQTLTRLDR